jgi:hypothetical protein
MALRDRKSRSTRHYVGKDGVERDYETHLLRRSYREDGKVKNETVANLSHLPGDLIEMTTVSRYVDRATSFRHK